MPSAVPIFLKMADEKQVIYFTWPKIELLITQMVSSNPHINHHMIIP